MVWNGRIELTRYYRRRIEPGEDWEVFWTDRDGVEQVFVAQDRSLRLAEIEGSAWIADAEGRRRPLSADGGTLWTPTRRPYQKLFRPGRWRETPWAPYGLGNRSNPLVPWVHCAADQRLHPYGSRVIVPAFAGGKLPDGRVFDGRMRVADVGAAIQGPLRFDWMVGDETDDRALERPLRRRLIDAHVEAPADVPAGLDPLTARGLQRLLRPLGFDLGTSGPAGDGVDGKIGPLTLAALARAQAAWEAIPTRELGRWPIGAVTCWFLRAAAAGLSLSRA